MACSATYNEDLVGSITLTTGTMLAGISFITRDLFDAPPIGSSIHGKDLVGSIARQ